MAELNKCGLLSVTVPIQEIAELTLQSGSVDHTSIMRHEIGSSLAHRGRVTHRMIDHQL